MRRLLTREESAQRNAGRLLDAAEMVFIERGYHATTVGAVAARAGLTTGAIYSRFGSKADLFLALLEARNARALPAAAAMFGEADSAEELVATFGRWWAARLAEGPAWSLALIEFWTSAGRDPALLERFAESHRRLMSAIGEVIDAAAARIGVELAVPSTDLARVTSALGRGLEIERLLDEAAVDDQLIAWAFDAFAQPDARTLLVESKSSAR
jgi:AcrR family transcriptional regulator